MPVLWWTKLTLDVLVVALRACVKAHRVALTAQRHVWHAMLRDNVAFKDLQRSFEAMEMAEKQATTVYRR